MNNNQDDSAPLEVLPPSAIMAMEKAQIDMQIATAHQYPRSLDVFKKRALSMATLDPDTADSCIYVRPVGKENGKQKFAEGPSIRLAEIVAVSYGNLRAASKVVEQTERYVKCVGMAHDLESNTAMSADCIESTVTRDGTPYSERQRALIAKVCGAKALRDSIFKVVPRALCKPIMEAAKKVASGLDKPLEERRKKAQAWITTLKIDESRVFAALSVAGWSDVTAEHLITLTGLKTSMSDGDTTIDEAFPPVAKTPQFAGPGQPATPGTAEQAKGALKPSQTSQPAGSDKAPPAPQTPAQTAKAAESTPSEQKTETLPPAEGQKPPSTRPNRPTMVEEPLGKPEGEQTTPAVTDNVSEAPRAPQPGEFVPNPNENEALTNIRFLCFQYGVSEAELMAWCRAPGQKLAKDGQQLSELASGKLLSLGKLWAADPKAFLAKLRPAQ